MPTDRTEHARIRLRYTAEELRRLRVEVEDIIAELEQAEPAPNPPPPTPLPPNASAWDPNLTRRGVKVEASDPNWMLVHARYKETPEETGGRHHIYIDVQDALGVRMVGAPWNVGWLGGGHSLRLEAKPNEPFGGNYAMYEAGNPYFILFEGWRISGMGMGTIAEPTVKYHVVYEFIFRQANAPAVPPAGGIDANG